MTIKLEPAKARNHRALFNGDLPFQPRRETPRTVYKRRPKHKNKSGAEE